MKFVEILLLAFITRISCSGVINEISCDFSDGFCRYEHYHGDRWTIKSIDTFRQSVLTDGPLSEPAGGGPFLVLTAANGTLNSPMVTMKGVYCLSVDFYLYNSHGYLNIYAQQPSINMQNLTQWIRQQDFPLFSRNSISSYVDKWQHYEKTLNFNDSIYEIFIEALTDTQDIGSIALSKLKFVKGSCPNHQRNTKICDFDGIVGSVDSHTLGCDWITPIQNDVDPIPRYLNWKVTSADKLTRHLEVESYDNDESTRSPFGGYLKGMKFEREPLELALLEIQPEDGRQCLSFWLKSGFWNYVWDVVQTNEERNYTKVLYLSSPVDTAPIWSMKQFDIDPIMPVVVKFRIIESGRGAINLDSFKLIKGRCPKRAHCDFKDRFCGFRRNVMHDRSHLRIGRGRLMYSNATEVLQDDYQDNYLYADFTNPKDHPDPDFQLDSEVISKVGLHCVSASYASDRNAQVILKIGTGEGGFVKKVVHNFQTRNQDGIWKIAFFDRKIVEPVAVELFVFGNDEEIFRVRKFSVDEGNCENVFNPPAPGPKMFEGVNFHCHQTGHYIPKYRSCDGVIDCPMGEDEDEHCTEANCSGSGIPCRKQGINFCLNDLDQLCDGIADCEDSNDEDPRFCSAELFCDNYCLNNGVCNHDAFNCNCDEGFVGKRCT